MKKLVFLLMLLSFNANAVNLTQTIGVECSRILCSLNSFDYPDVFDTIKKRNSQFWALQKCLNVYKENDGNIEELNKEFEKSFPIAKSIYNQCSLDKKNCPHTCVNLKFLMYDDFSKEVWINKLKTNSFSEQSTNE